MLTAKTLIQRADAQAGLGLCWTATFGFAVLWHTVKILKIGTPEIITITVIQLEQLDFTVQYCVQKMQTE